MKIKQKISDNVYNNKYSISDNSKINGSIYYFKTVILTHDGLLAS
jgi:hypothetical protein